MGGPGSGSRSPVVTTSVAYAFLGSALGLDPLVTSSWFWAAASRSDAYWSKVSGLLLFCKASVKHVAKVWHESDRIGQHDDELLLGGGVFCYLVVLAKSIEPMKNEGHMTTGPLVCSELSSGQPLQFGVGGRKWP
ncbi:unnamed protein product [Cylindrotheca closterium]|uniref:Uncharacterized protein n=1 Tax=Cylindrotheca closterium TaxID=2856 RepID=A0AAD2CHI7_9STRA|nr:unnamed protein product [Cylindrotheca closterium]